MAKKELTSVAVRGICLGLACLFDIPSQPVCNITRSFLPRLKNQHSSEADFTLDQCVLEADILLLLQGLTDTVLPHCLSPR